MRNTKVLSTVLLLLFMTVPLPASSRTTQTQCLLERSVSQPPLSSGIVGMLAVKSNGDTVAAFNAGRNMLPASNVKLITTGIALKTLGKDYRFETLIAYSGRIVDSTLVGNLYVIGGGDPTLAVEDMPGREASGLFADWMSIVKSAGISKIDGAVIGDGGYFHTRCGVESWSLYDASRSYGAFPSGLNFNENRQVFRFVPGREKEDGVEFKVKYPQTPWMDFRNDCYLSGPKDAEGISYIATPLAKTACFSGSCPAGRRPFDFEAANSFPELTCAYYFYNYLRDNGVDVGDYAAGSSAGTVLTPIGRTCSDNLAGIVRHTNHESDNFCAETLFRMIGRKVCGSSRTDSCRIAEQKILSSMSMAPAAPFNIEDGSGLSRKNYMSPGFLVGYLLAMSRSGIFKCFLGSLPQAGEGTLERRLKTADDSVKKRVYMKSGSMNGVLCFSGYVVPDTGDTDNTGNILAFSIMTNNMVGSSRTVGSIIDEILISLASEI